MTTKHTITYKSFNCTYSTGSMTLSSCTCQYRKFGDYFQSFVITLCATSSGSIPRSRHYVYLPSGYSFGTMICCWTRTNDSYNDNGHTAAFNCPVWVSGSSMCLDVLRGDGSNGTSHVPPLLHIQIITT